MTTELEWICTNSFSLNLANNVSVLNASTLIVVVTHQVVSENASLCVRHCRTGNLNGNLLDAIKNVLALASQLSLGVRKILAAVVVPLIVRAADKPLAVRELLRKVRQRLKRTIRLALRVEDLTKFRIAHQQFGSTTVLLGYGILELLRQGFNRVLVALKKLDSLGNLLLQLLSSDLLWRQFWFSHNFPTLPDCR